MFVSYEKNKFFSGNLLSLSFRKSILNQSTLFTGDLGLDRLTWRLWLLLFVEWFTVRKAQKRGFPFITDFEMGRWK